MNRKLILVIEDHAGLRMVEGMFLGLPIICMDHCGFSDIINGSNGVAVSVENPARSIKEIADAIIYFEGNEKSRYEMGHEAAKSMDLFAWERKSKVIRKIYESCT